MRERNRERGGERKEKREERTSGPKGGGKKEHGRGLYRNEQLGEGKQSPWAGEVCGRSYGEKRCHRY